MTPYNRYMPRLTYRIFGGMQLYPVIKALGHYPDYFWWVLRGRPVRSPHLLKQRTVLEYGRRYRLRTFVETGTYHGEMVRAVLGHFDHIYSIELNPEWAAFASRRFARHPEVRIVVGDSRRKVAELLAEITEPALFWLDAAYYGTGAQRGNLERLLAELQAILSHRQPDHVVLMDDARTFTGTGVKEALTAAQLAAKIEHDFPARTVAIERDIFRITRR